MAALRIKIFGAGFQLESFSCPTCSQNNRSVACVDFRPVNIRMANSDDEADRKVTKRVKLGFPSLDGRGAHVNISGGGVAANAPNKENAVRLLEFFASAEAQTHIAAENNEFPASPDVAPPAPVDAYADFTANPMNVSAFAVRQPEAQSLMSAAGWR